MSTEKHAQCISLGLTLTKLMQAFRHAGMRCRTKVGIQAELGSERRAFRLSIMFLATATCMPVNGTVVPRSSDTFVAAAAGTGAGAGALAAGLLTAAAVTSVAAQRHGAKVAGD